MRISEQEKQDIIELARRHISGTARVWLFGSRVNDNARGGDVDIMIEVDQVDSIVERKINFRLALEDRWGERKVDVLIYDTQYQEQPIHSIARQEGIRLV